MSHRENYGRPDALRMGAFTLIEIIVAMTIIAVIAAVAVPTLKGLNDDEKMRAPLQALAEMVQDVRQRAVKEHRPYEIVFERDGLHAIPGNRSFSAREEFLKHLEELRTPPVITTIEREKPEQTEMGKNEPKGTRGMKERPTKIGEGSPPNAPPEPAEMPWTLTLPMDKMKCEVLMWGDGEWDPLEGDRMRRWVFQANGMASPAKVRLSVGATQLEAGFDTLTGEMTGERTQPTRATATR